MKHMQSFCFLSLWLAVTSAMIFSIQAIHAQEYSLAKPDPEITSPEVFIYPSPMWAIESVQPLLCVKPACDTEMTAVVAHVTLEGDEQAIEVSPDNISVLNASGEKIGLNGIILMSIPNSAKASVVGLMTYPTVAIGDVQYKAHPFGFAYEGKLSESLISGSITLQSGIFHPQQGSQTITELLPMKLERWLTQGHNVALKREIFATDKSNPETVLAFLISAGQKERMLLAGPQGETVKLALLFSGLPNDFDTIIFSDNHSLRLKPSQFDQFKDAVLQWWSR
jgi:hypothetical protein